MRLQLTITDESNLSIETSIIDTNNKMQKCYIISFDLKEGRSYTNLIEAIKAYGTWARITESTYAVVTGTSAAEVRDNLVQYLNPDDRIFVVKTGGVAAWRHAIAGMDWLQKFLVLS